MKSQEDIQEELNELYHKKLLIEEQMEQLDKELLEIENTIEVVEAHPVITEMDIIAEAYYEHAKSQR